MPPHIKVFNVVWRMLHHEFSAKGMKLTVFTEVKGNVKNEITDILNQPESICNMFNDEEKDTLDFELPVDERDLEDSDFGIDENNETFAHKKIRERRKPRIFHSKLEKSVFKSSKLEIDAN